MRKVVLSTIAVASLTLPMLSFAGTTGNEPIDSHFYVQADIGSTNLDISSDALHSQSMTNDKFSYAIRAGYEYATTNSWRWGLEIGYLNLGKATFNNFLFRNANVVIKQQAIDFVAVLTKDINSKFSLFGKAGFAYLDQSSTLNGQDVINSSPVDDAEKSVPELGGGLSINLTTNINIVGTVTHLFSDSIKRGWTTDQAASSTMASAGIRYNFV